MTTDDTTPDEEANDEADEYYDYDDTLECGCCACCGCDCDYWEELYADDLDYEDYE